MGAPSSRVAKNLGSVKLAGRTVRAYARVYMEPAQVFFDREPTKPVRHENETEENRSSCQPAGKVGKGHNPSSGLGVGYEPLFDESSSTSLTTLQYLNEPLVIPLSVYLHD